MVHEALEQSLKQKAKQESIKKGSRTLLKIIVKAGARVVSVAGLVLISHDAKAPGVSLPLPAGYKRIGEGLLESSWVKEVQIEAAEEQRIIGELQRLTQLLSNPVAMQQAGLAQKLRQLVFEFCSRVPSGPIDPAKHSVKQYEGWGLEKLVELLVKNYQNLDNIEKQRVRELLNIYKDVSELNRLAKIQAVYDAGMPDPAEDPEGALWYLLNKEGRGEKLTVQEQNLIEKLSLRLGLAIANDWLIPSSEERMPQNGEEGEYQTPDLPFRNTLFRGHLGIKGRYVDLYVDDFEKIDKSKYSPSSLETIDAFLVTMARDSGADMIVIRFDGVKNPALWTNQNNWAQKYGYHFKRFYYEIDGNKKTMVIWIKYIF